MMGTKARLFTPLPSISLEDLVPANHFYRHLDRTLDLSFVRNIVQGSYASAGRPSVDPVIFFKLQLVMFFEGLRSERQLLRLAADRLSIRWYLGFNLDEPLPDHSSLTRIRTRYGLDVFRRFFDVIIEQCQQAELVWGKELFFDATQVQADAALDSLKPRFAVEAREAIGEEKAKQAKQAKEKQEEQVNQAEQAAKQAVEGHLAALFSLQDAQDAQPERQLKEFSGGSKSNASSFAEPYPQEMILATEATEAIESISTVPTVPISLLPTVFTGSAYEELILENAARHDWFAEGGQQQREVTHCYRPRTADFRISTTDRDATPMHLKGGGTHLGYQTHYVVDGGKSRIIMAVLVTPGEVMENQPMLDLLWHTRFRYHLKPKQVTGDTTYGTIENITALEREHIRAYVPLPNWEHKTGYFGPSQFIYDAERDIYTCPQHHPLRPHRTRYTDERVEYRAEAATCNACPLKAQCTPSEHGRRVNRHFAEPYLDRVRAYHQTAAYQKAMRKRKVWIEPLFAEGKEWHGLRRFHLRRLWKVNSEALLIGAGQNLKRLLAKRGWGRRPLPNSAALTINHQIESLNGLLTWLLMLVVGLLRAILALIAGTDIAFFNKLVPF